MSTTAVKEEVEEAEAVAEEEAEEEEEEDTGCGVVPRISESSGVSGIKPKRELPEPGWYDNEPDIDV